MKPLKTLVAAAALASLAVPAFAHHSGAMFDRTKTATLTGTVKEFNWTNPHSSFAIEAPDRAGKPAVWYFEMNSPQNLVREGWRRSTIKPGDKVTVTYNPLRDGKPGGWYVGIKLPDGSYIGGSEPK